MPEKSTTRSYRSTLRSEQAAATRRRVLDAAAACFSENGYSGTSLADIGARAGVSPETVKANGPKRDLLLRAFEQAFAGAEGDDQIAASEAGAELAGIQDAEDFLAATAGFVAAANARTSVLWTEFLSAANADAAVQAELTGLLERRKQDYRSLAGMLFERGMVRTSPVRRSRGGDPEAGGDQNAADDRSAAGARSANGGRSADADPVAIDDAAAALSFLWSPESHQQLVLQAGWSMERYTRWLAGAASRQLAD